MSFGVRSLIQNPNQKRWLCTGFKTITAASQIDQYSPRCQKKIFEYKESVNEENFTTEVEERANSKRIELDKFIQKQMRDLLNKFSPKDVSTHFFEPMYRSVEFKYLIAAIELSDLTPKFLVSVLESFTSTVSLKEEEILQLYKGGAANYNNTEFLELMIEWERVSNIPSKEDPLYGYIWGQRLGYVIPVVNVQFLMSILQPLVLNHWNRDITWGELFDKQSIRFEGWAELEPPTVCIFFKFQILDFYLIFKKRFKNVM